MSIKSRTIDNLGLESSVRYAKDQTELDPQLIKDSRLITPWIEVAATKPYIPSEFDKLFSAKPTIQWAVFSEPPTYDVQPRSLFSYQLIPSLGSSEKQEAEAEKLEALKETLGKEKGTQDENQRKRLLEFFKCLEKLDKTLLFINSRRNQYQRG